jgi:heterodisulfide reductase subunit C
MHKVTGSTNFAAEVVQLPSGESLSICYSCGTCVSRCIIPWRDPAFNPRQLLHRAMLNMRQEVFEDITIWYCTACDLCYSSCPQEIHISEVIGALRQLALQAGNVSPLDVVSVNPVLCAGCGSCVAICPYEALSLEFRGNVHISTVDPNRCVGCGGCVTACPNKAIGGGSFADQPICEQLNQVLHDWV